MSDWLTLSGGQRPAVRVKLNAQAIAALGLTSETVRTAITRANVNSAKGSLDGPSRAVTLSANDQMQSAEEYRQLIIAYQNGAPIRLGDVATVEQGAENSWLGAWANKEQAIVMNVQRQPGANIISTADSIRQMLPQLTESLPKSVKVTVLPDRTTISSGSTNDTQFELMMGHCAGSHDYLPVFAQYSGDHHSRLRSAAVVNRHLRGHGVFSIFQSIT